MLAIAKRFFLLASWTVVLAWLSLVAVGIAVRLIQFWVFLRAGVEVV